MTCPYTLQSFSSSSPTLKNNSGSKHTAKPSSAKPHVHSAKANADAPPGSLAAGPKVVVGTAGSSATPASPPTGEAPTADISKLNHPMHDTGAAQAAPIFGAPGSPTTKGLKSPQGAGAPAAGMGGVPGTGGPGASTPRGGGGAGTILLLLAALGVGGGTYYYWDDVKGYLLFEPEKGPVKKEGAKEVTKLPGSALNAEGSYGAAAGEGKSETGLE